MRMGVSVEMMPEFTWRSFAIPGATIKKKETRFIASTDRR
eukprot:COSAG02_NODE_754_length_17578_cov_97.544825_15_plen_40_part_00